MVENQIEAHRKIVGGRNNKLSRINRSIHRIIFVGYNVYIHNDNKILFVELDGSSSADEDSCSVKAL